jgi:hypothetical protein
VSQALNHDLPSILAVSLTTSSTAVNSGFQTNADKRGIKLYVTSSQASAGSFIVTIQGIYNGVAVTVLASAAISTATTNVYTVYPGLTAAANSVANDVLPRQWQVTLTPTGFTGVVNVGACLIV